MLSTDLNMYEQAPNAIILCRREEERITFTS